MIPTQAVQNAQSWYEEGVQRIESGSISLGITYLEKAIALFAEEDSPRVLTYARHHKLLGLKLDRRYEEAESQFADVMQGYTQLEDSYGKGLLLAHLAECLARTRLAPERSYADFARFPTSTTSCRWC